MQKSAGAYNDKRPREYLADEEMARVVKAAKGGRHSKRDYAICMLLWRHGMRVSELCGLKMQWLDLDNPDGPRMKFKRLKGSDDAENHIFQPETLRALKAWLRVRPAIGDSVFLSAQGTPMHRMSVYYLVKTWGERALIPFPIHPHMFRHSCGYHIGAHAPTRVVQAFLGHRDIRNTARYTDQHPDRFRTIWGT